MLRICSRCRLERPEALFRMKGRGTSRHSYCNDCFREYRRAYRARPEVVAKELARAPARRVEMRAYRRRPDRLSLRREQEKKAYVLKGPRWVKTLTQGAANRAKKNNVPFDRAAVQEVLRAAPDICPVLGTAFTTGAGRCDSSASLDRLKPALGYVRGNLAVISWLANRIKTNATADQILAVGKWLKSIGSN